MRKRLKIQTLDSRWHDKDNVMLHAAFQCLVDFIEKEKPDEIVDWEGTGSEAYTAWNEMNVLYAWWKARPAGWSDDTYEEDQIMLHRLVEIRGFLWT